MTIAAQVRLLTRLIDSSEVGEYSIPADLLAAWWTFESVKALTIEDPQILTAEEASGNLVSAVAARETVDPLELARQVELGVTERAVVGRARVILEMAHEQAAHKAVLTAREQCDSIISEHLAPALEQVYTQARKVASALDGYDLRNAHALVTAPSRVRQAFASLPALVERRRVIWDARSAINRVAGREPQHDTGGHFLQFQNPVHFVKSWTPTTPLPRAFGPEDPTDRLLWLASDEVAPALRWLPTVEQQDAAWLGFFGAGVELRKNRASDARAMRGLLDS